MSHILSAAAENARGGADLIIINLPASGDEPPAVIRLSTSTVPTIEGENYQSSLRSVPEITYTDGGDVDGGEFTISNLSQVYGQAFLNTDRALDGAECIIIRALKLMDGTWEIRDPDTNEVYELARGPMSVEPISKEIVKCMFVAYTSDATQEVGGERISQNCKKIFNFGGNHPLGGPCGWKVSMGGDPDFCDYTPTGCKSHNNYARFGGIQPLMPNTGASTPSGITPIQPVGGYGPGAAPSRDNPDWDIDTRRPFMLP